ncbi:type III pantothenate kinase [Eremococcus coleocola]|uniref:Type III pantothenate kinase n=1 Tax=Eremococcus coleocola ACS-139-V-Col8 TaxID=908337 RepID=E4KQ42_9LACT|nr:type III pantothenate kinase [Eremococcus coleocola]EFR30981.1 pantothenate kinase [Eremococcus coleocola ACS-139-V-Col8]
MLLAINIGNSNIDLGLYQDLSLIHHWCVSMDPNKTVDEYGLLFTQLLASEAVEVDQVSAIILSSVVPNIMDTMPIVCQKFFKQSPMIVGAGVKTGLNIRYDDPKEVGADRIVNAVAVKENYGTPAIVMDMGTAFTFDVIDVKGDYVGGLISPGIKITADSLVASTSKLPKIEIKHPRHLIGKNTVQAMQSGLVNGYIGMVDYIIKAIVKEMDLSIDQTNLVATGNYAKLIANLSDYPIEINPLLTLEGLCLIYQRNKA